LFVLHLSELLVFSGSENVALRQPVKTSSNLRESSGAWDKRFLVDGFMPYLMDSAQGNQSVAYASASGEQPVISLDLGTKYLLNRIHLHAVDQSDTVPQAYAGDLGMPRHLRIEGANTPDFSNAVVLLDTIRETINDTGPIMMWRIPGKTCRFVRFMAAETDIPMDPNAPTFRIGFAEIELFSHGHNVALGKSAFTNESHKRRFRTPVALTDGHNLYGRILPIRTWVEELARRHNLETERPLITAELSRRYARQKTNLTRMGWLAGLLTAGTIIMVLVDRIIKQRTIFQLRKQIAADLHDELGGNLHAISLLSDLSLEAKASPDKLVKLLHRMRALSERTSTAALHCTNMLEAEGLYEDLVRDMQKISSHLMTDLEHNISFEGEPLIQQIKPRRRIDLFLFYKECLTNILRHSSATQVAVTLVARQGHITLRVADNGQGLGASETNEVPVSLKHRARLLGAKVAAECSTNGGTCITLQLRI
jgi:signal transduction histidine kinase